MSKKCLSLEELAALAQATLDGDPKKMINGVADLEKAADSDVSFLANPKYFPLMATTHAGAVFVTEDIQKVPGKNYLISKNPSKSFQRAIEYFFVNPADDSSFSKGIHQTAVIDPSVVLEENVSVGPHVVIDKGVYIGKGTHIIASVFIGANTTIGQECVIHPNVTIRENCSVGSRVIIQPGVVIGSCGYGYNTDSAGVHTKLSQLGNVVIEDDVEIGANTTIDRGRFQETRIGKGSKIDNLVMIAHGVEIGSYNLIVAQAGIAGSTKTGSHCVIAAQAGIVGHIELESGVVVAAKSGVPKSLKKGYYSGIPVQELKENHRIVIHQRKLPEYAKRIRELEKRLDKLLDTNV